MILVNMVLDAQFPFFFLFFRGSFMYKLFDIDCGQRRNNQLFYQMVYYIVRDISIILRYQTSKSFKSYI